MICILLLSEFKRITKMAGGSKKTQQSQPQAIDLAKLNLMQLTQFKNQLDQDLQFYQESLQNLKHAQSKYEPQPKLGKSR